MATTTPISKKQQQQQQQGKNNVIRNEKIKFPNLRVVYKDPVTGENSWKLMERKEAIKFAASLSLDLILGKLSLLLFVAIHQF